MALTAEKLNRASSVINLTGNEQRKWDHLCGANLANYANTHCVVQVCRPAGEIQ